MPAVQGPHWDAFRDTAMGRYLLHHEQAFLTGKLAGVSTPFHLLEIGTCTGRVTEPLRDVPGFVITGLDTDFDALAVFQARRGSHAAVVADASRLPFADDSFDGIAAIQCLRYFEPVAFLRGCHRVLSPGGWLIVQAVNGSSYKRRIKQVVKRSSGPRGSYVLTAEELLRHLDEGGFVVEHVRGYNWLPFKPDISPLSDSRLVGYAATVERRLPLDRFDRISPWILVAARKSPSSAAGPVGHAASASWPTSR